MPKRMNVNRITWFAGLLGLVFMLSVCPVMAGVSAPHPRYLTTPSGKETTWNLIKQEKWAKDVFEIFVS